MVEPTNSGRKLFRRLNKIERTSKIKDRLQAFTPATQGLEIPEGFHPHNGLHGLGKWQLDFLKSHGLEPHHDILDIGCGDLCAGVPLIRYLDKGKYVGADQSEIAIRQGALSLSLDDWAKDPIFLLGGAMDFDNVGRRFDYAWAHSVWTHIDLSLVGRCMEAVHAALRPGGLFMTTVFLAPEERPFSTESPYRDSRTDKDMGPKSTYGYRNPYHHPLLMLQWIAEQAGFRFDLLPEATPKTQRVLRMMKPI